MLGSGGDRARGAIRGRAKTASRTGRAGSGSGISGAGPEPDPDGGRDAAGPQPGEPLQCRRRRYVQPGRGGRVAAGLCAEFAVQRCLCDRPGDPQSGRSLPGRVSSPARRACLGFANPVGRQQRAAALGWQPDPDRPQDRQARPQRAGRRPLQHVFHARRQVRDRRRRTIEAARFPRPAHDGIAAVGADAGLLGRQPRRFLDRRPLCDLHLRVSRRRARQGRYGRPQGAGISKARRPRHAARHPYLARRQGVFYRRHARRRGLCRGWRQFHQGGLYPDRASARTGSTRAATAPGFMSRTAARTRFTVHRTGRAASA